MQYKERLDVRPAGGVSVLTFCNFEKVPWNPPIPDSEFLTFTRPGYTQEYERFFGETRSDGHYRRNWKPVQHYARRLQPWGDLGKTWFTYSWLHGTALGYFVGATDPSRLGILLPFDDPAVYVRYGSFGDHINGLPSLTEEQPDGGFIPPPVGLDVLTQRAFGSMKLDIKSEISAINSIIELKDFATLPRSIANLWSFVNKIPYFARNVRSVITGVTGAFTYNVGGKKFTAKLIGAKSGDTYKRIRESFKPSDGPTFAEAIGVGADGYLQTQFNILPLFRDISQLWSGVKTIQSKINDLVSRQGKPRLKHFTLSYLPALPTSPTEVETFLLDGGQFTARPLANALNVERQVIVESPSVFHAEFEYNYSFSKYQVENAQLLGLLDMMGVNLNPAIIWNAIPWSFLVDWVLGVSRWLAGRKVLNMEPVFNFTRYLWSIKHQRRIRVSFWSHQHANGAGSIDRTYLPDLYEEAYRRDITVPVRNHPLFGGSLDSKEISLGAALAITRKRRVISRV